MSDEKHSEGKLSRLRIRAEKTLSGEPSDREDFSALSPEEIKRLVHELRVHQIELEMQNDNLREAQVNLEELKDRYLDLYDFAPAGYFTLNEQGLILEANLTAVRLLGVDRRKLIERPFSRFVCEEFIDAYYSHLRKVFETGSKQTCEIGVTRDDGTHFHAQLESVAAQDESGGFSRCRTILSDITDRKNAEDALRKSQSELHAIYDYAPVMMCVLDGQRQVLYANRAFADFVGKNQSDLRAGSACGVFGCINALDDPRGCGYGPQCESCSVRLAIEDTYKTGLGHRNIEYRSTLVGSGLQREVVLLGSTAIIEAGDRTSVLLCLEDITDRKKAEEERESLRNQLLQAQKMEAIGTLTGGIAHDFNNLLTIMNGYTEMILMDTTEDDPIYADLRNILQTGRKGAELIQRLLSLTGQTAINVEPMDLNHRIEETKNLVDRTFPKMIEIETILTPDLPMVNADAGQIDQLLMNLCVNSKDAMPDGGHLRIETRNTTVAEDYCRLNVRAKPGLYVMIAVADTGIGMSKETMDRIFDPFFTTKGWDFKKGTGLGLSVAKGIVEQHNGWMTCESEPGIGTTFRVYFPAIEESSVVRKPDPIAETVRGTEKILLVDDEEHVRDLGKRILERAGYTVITASNGREALETYVREQSDIALIVLDLIMPQMGGQRCLEEMLKINPHVKAIISTGHSLDARERLHLAALAKAFVDKPYKVGQLVQTIKKFLPPD
jgi:two-component system, cell cycle sensor histidine kinase and response regulator CckA